MYELVQAGTNSYYLNFPAKIGIYVNPEKEAYLIDSGNSKDAGKKALKIITENGWQVRAIINTHFHADHIGGNYFIQQKTGCLIFAPDIEAEFIRNPILEPSFLYGGYPFKNLKHHFLMAAESQVLSLEDPRFPKELEIIPLPGHSFSMIGIRTPDDTVFLADTLCSENTLNKYGISYLYDVEKTIQTLFNLKSLKAGIFVPSHADTTSDILDLVDLNLSSIHGVIDYIESICEKNSFEDLLQKIFFHYGLTMTGEQYVLIGSTLRSYLAWLEENNRIQFQIEDNKMLWSLKTT